MKRLLAYLVLAAGMAGFVTGCSGVSVQSSWRNPDVKIDGAGDEWVESLVQIGNTSTAVGVSNDAEALYLAIVPWNQQVLVQVAGTGLYLWFQPERDAAKRFALHFPNGDVSIALQMAQTLSRTETLKLIRQLADQDTMVELLDHDSRVIAKLSRADAAANGLEVSLGDYRGRLMIEARIPWNYQVNGRGYELSPDGPIILNVQTPVDVIDERVRQQDEQRGTDPFIFNQPSGNTEVVAEPNLFRFPLDFDVNIQPVIGSEQ